jgi:hypothetical protein
VARPAPGAAAAGAAARAGGAARAAAAFRERLEHGLALLDLRATDELVHRRGGCCGGGGRGATTHAALRAASGVYECAGDARPAASAGGGAATAAFREQLEHVLALLQLRDAHLRQVAARQPAHVGEREAVLLKHCRVLLQAAPLEQQAQR